jgi:hypothetical protein
MRLIRPLITFIFALYPIYGAVEWGWQFHDLLALYWFESLVFVADAMLKYWSTHRNFLIAKKEEAHSFEQLSVGKALSWKLRVTGMFLFLLGFFGVLHAAMLWNVFISDSTLNAGNPTYGTQKLVEYVVNSDLIFGILFSAGFRFLLYVFDFMFRGKYKTSEASVAMVMCIMRLFILHISLIVLGFIFDIFDANAFGLLVAFVVFKALIDAGIGEIKPDVMEKKKDETNVES